MHTYIHTYILFLTLFPQLVRRRLQVLIAILLKHFSKVRYGMVWYVALTI